jgi:two-component system response regulator ResD
MGRHGTRRGKGTAAGSRAPTGAQVPVAQRILVVEDDARIADLITKNLESAGYECHASTDGGRALADFTRVKPALIVLDLGLAGIDGLEVTRRVRRESDVPILMVTARTSEADKLLGLEIGADDYVTKPFSTAELVARVRALLRRAGGAVTERALECGGLVIDPARRAVTREGLPVPLTTLEFDLLYFLASRPGRVFSREALMEQVWGSDRVVDDRSIDSLVSRLRRKLERDAARPRYIQTIWGAGYRFPEGGP